MGASTFEDVAWKPSAKNAFAELVDDARYQYGHGGYSGTMAEKHDFQIVPRPPMTLAEARTLSAALMDDMDTYGDKWGPAFALELKDEKKGTGWFFFGWASS